MKVSIPREQSCPCLGTSGSNPDIVHRDRPAPPPEVHQHSAEDFRCLEIDRKDLDCGGSQEFFQFRKVLFSVPALFETGEKLAQHNGRNPNPIGSVEDLGDSGLPTLEVRISDRIEALATHFQSSPSISSKGFM